MLEARNVSYTALSGSGETIAVLRGVDFQAGAGTFTGIVGPNGAGKTTLLRALAGLLPAAGEIRLDGKPVSSYPPRVLARKIAYMHQDTTVPFDFTPPKSSRWGAVPGSGRSRSPPPRIPGSRRL